MFYAHTAGTPDILFCLLLDQARNACAVTGMTANQSNMTPEEAVAAQQAKYMAGLLLRDDNYVLARLPRNVTHRYVLDFLAGTIQLNTQLYVTQDQSTALFKVRFQGKIQGRAFQVHHASTRKLLAQVSERELRKPEFFLSELARLTYRAQHTVELLEEDLTDILNESITLRVDILFKKGNKPTLVTGQLSEPQALISDAETGEVAGALPTKCALCDAFPQAVACWTEISENLQRNGKKNQKTLTPAQEKD